MRNFDPQQEMLASVTDEHAEAARPVQQAPSTEPQHTDDWHRRNDARALELQLAHIDAMRRCGAL